MKFNHSLTHSQFISRCIGDFNVKLETVKLLGEIGKSHDIGLGNNFLDMTLKVQATKAKINKIKNKSINRT